MCNIRHKTQAEMEARKNQAMSIECDKPKIILTVIYSSNNGITPEEVYKEYFKGIEFEAIKFIEAGRGKNNVKMGELSSLDISSFGNIKKIMGRYIGEETIETKNLFLNTNANLFIEPILDIAEMVQFFKIRVMNNTLTADFLYEKDYYYLTLDFDDKFRMVNPECTCSVFSNDDFVNTIRRKMKQLVGIKYTFKGH